MAVQPLLLQLELRGACEQETEETGTTQMQVKWMLSDSWDASEHFPPYFHTRSSSIQELLGSQLV